MMIGGVGVEVVRCIVFEGLVLLHFDRGWVGPLSRLRLARLLDILDRAALQKEPMDRNWQDSSDQTITFDVNNNPYNYR